MSCSKNTIFRPVSKKGQSLIIEFTLFFLIGIGVFIGLGNFFRLQSDNIRYDITNLSLEMVNSYMTSVAVSSFGECKDCGTIENSLSLSPTYAGYLLNIALDDNGLTISNLPSTESYYSTINNLNDTIDIIKSSVPSYKTINFTYSGPNSTYSLLKVS